MIRAMHRLMWTLFTQINSNSNSNTPKHVPFVISLNTFRPCVNAVQGIKSLSVDFRWCVPKGMYIFMDNLNCELPAVFDSVHENQYRHYRAIVNPCIIWATIDLLRSSFSSKPVSGPHFTHYKNITFVTFPCETNSWGTNVLNKYKCVCGTIHNGAEKMNERKGWKGGRDHRLPPDY